jgi:hypothetical protein
MPDVLLSNDDVTVLGPPEIVEVLVDIGPTGTRGSQVFAGIGDPNVIEIGQTPILNDLYINASPGNEYAYMYQYVSQPGGNTWIPLLSVNPTIYSGNHLVVFASGVGDISIPISDIIDITGTPLSADNFSVQYTIAHDNPIASSMTIPALVDTGESGPTGDNLIINFKAVEHRTDVDSGPYGDWALLNAEVVVHVFISILAIQES